MTVGVDNVSVRDSPDSRTYPPRPALPGLQIGRAFAALSVAAFHLAARGGAGGEPLFGNWLFFGRLGVDFFFVLSGFIILHAHKADIGNPARLGRYTYRRLTRVYPIYLLVLGLAFVVAYRAGHPQLNAPTIVSEVTLIHFVPTPLFLSVEWTLFNEIFFYALFSMLILSRTLGMCALGAWLIWILYSHTYYPWGYWSQFFTVTTAQNLDFFMGMGVALVYQRVNRLAAAAIIIGSVLVMLRLIVLEKYSGENFLLRFPYGLCFAGMVLFAAQATVVRSPIIQGLVALGDASFALYLIHVMVESRVRDLFDKLHLNHDLSFLPVLALTIIVAWLFHRYVERPILHLLRPKAHPRRNGSARLAQ